MVAKLRKPTKKQYDDVEKAAGFGASNDEICAGIGVSKSSLKRYFGKSLETGRSRGRYSVKKKVHEMALAGNVPMIQLYAKFQMGWKDDPASLRAAAETPDGIKFEVELVKL